MIEQMNTQQKNVMNIQNKWFIVGTKSMCKLSDNEFPFRIKITIKMTTTKIK